MKKSTIYFITGANGAGKSTLIPILKKKLPSQYQVYDFDERGVPKNVNAKWRKKETNYWISIGLRNARKNVTTIVCGLAMPDEIYEIAKQRKGIRIKICLLDVSAKEIHKRIKKRYATPTSIRHLKSITGDSLLESIQGNINHAKEFRKQCKKHKCKFFNTSKTTPKQTAAKIINWINFNHLKAKK